MDTASTPPPTAPVGSPPATHAPHLAASVRLWPWLALIGAVGGLVSAAVMLWAARAWDGVILAQLLSDRMTWLLPTAVFGRVLGELENNAKPLTLVSLTVLQMVLGALLAVTFARRAALRGVVARVASGALLAVVVWLLLSFVAAPLGQIGVLGLDASGDLWRVQGTFVAAALAFGAVVAVGLSLLRREWVASPAEEAGADAQAHMQASRRVVLRGGMVGVGALLLGLPGVVSGAYVGRYARSLRAKSAAPQARTETDASAGPFAFAGMPFPATPTDEFYVVSKNLVDPTVETGSWSLEIGGKVAQPLVLSYSDLLARESVEFTSTLECISNPVGGSYISNGVWRGFPLRDLLAEAGVQSGVIDIELHAADGYVESFPLSEGLAADTMVVHSLNGEPLPSAHGAPARLIVPGIFGMKNVKWVTRIDAVGEDIQGFWQERGWSDPAPVVTMSRIDVPKAGAKLVLGQATLYGGVAFAGDRGISRVEVSFDDGATWEDAELDAELSPLAWRLWRVEHAPLAGGHDGVQFVRVRATDGNGETQTAEERDTLPDGATGYHRVRTTVVTA